MTKGKILQPILFALALVMVFSVFGVAPAYAGCRHSYNSDSVYIRSNNRNDYFKVTKVCTKFHKRTSVAKNHDYRKIRIKRIRQGKKTLTQTRYKCARCGRIMSKIS